MRYEIVGNDAISIQVGFRLPGSIRLRGGTGRHGCRLPMSIQRARVGSSVDDDDVK